MRVAEEGDLGGHALQRRPGVAHGDDVVILIQRRAVGDKRTLRGEDGALWDGAQPFEICRRQVTMRPGGRFGSDWIEACGTGESAADAVMVAADVDARERTDVVDDLVGVGAVAD